MNRFSILSFIVISFAICYSPNIDGKNLFIAADSSYHLNSDSLLISDSLMVNNDSTSIADTLKEVVKIDSLFPIHQTALINKNEFGNTFTKSEIIKSDYRYTGDILNYLPFGFVLDQGSMGQPNEVSIYGNGYNGISYLIDGVNFNNRVANSLDLNNIQSEYIDSLEIVPLPKGFIYGSFNNPVTVNIMTKDHIDATPKSRIRFYQAPEEENYIDASFSAYLFKKFNFSFDATNNTVDSRFDNSDAGGWKASTRLRYMFSNDINITASYYYAGTKTHLNGGISSIDKNNIVYDNLQAEVVYPASGVFSDPSRYQKYTQHNFNLKLLGKFINNAPSDLSLYYLFNKTEYRQNELTNLANIPTILNDNKSKTLGLRFKQSLLVNPVDLLVLANYENIELEADLLSKNKSMNSFSLAGIGKLSLFENGVIPSVFAKYLNYNEESYYGFGGDVNFRLSNLAMLYAGASSFEKHPGIISEDYLTGSAVKQSIKNFEAGIKFKSKILNGSASFFSSSNDNEAFYTIDGISDTLIINEASSVFFKENNKSGLNLNFNLRFWKLLISANSSFYLDIKEEDNFNLPELSAFGGIYYIDTLFNSNLKLKAGFNFYYYGSQNYFSYDFEKSLPVKFAKVGNSYNLIKSESSNTSYRMDLFIAGQFQDAAIVYIVFENFLDEKYYLVPYFPKQPQSLRFGISWEFLN